MRKTIFIYFLFIFFIKLGYPDDMDSIIQFLPEKINAWHRSAEFQRIDSTTIFDYMNGGGELYLGYRFNHLEVCEYLSENKNTILVEIYEMNTYDDAYGLLSLDWSGESVSFTGQIESDSTNTLNTQALYGRGLLRLATGSYYIRIMASRETAEARNAIIKIGKIIYKDFSPAPEIVQLLPSLENMGWKINSNKIAFFRSHMVLNSLFYLSHQNILNLDHSVGAVTATYSSMDENAQSKPIQILIIEYINHQNAVAALNHFCIEFLPEKKITLNTKDTIYTDYFLIEDGWLTYKLDNNILSFVFNIPDKLSAEQIINHIKLHKHNGE